MHPLWHGRLQMAKTPRPESKARSPAPRPCPRGGDLVGDVGGMTFKRFGFVQGAVVSRWAEIVGERYAKVSTPESIRFPGRQEIRRHADLDRRGRACAADAASRRR